MELQDSKRSRVRIHRTAEFKSRLVKLSLEPGASAAGVAVAHGVNPNLLRRWVKESGSLVATPSFVPVRIASVAADQVHSPPGKAEQLEVRMARGDLHITFKVDSSQIAQLGQVFREVLR